MTKDELLEKLIECITNYNPCGDYEADAVLEDMLFYVIWYQKTLDK